MLHKLFVLLVLSFVLLADRNCPAAILVSLVATPSGNPVVLVSGETIKIDVMVSGIGEAGNPSSLEQLGVTLSFDPMSIGDPETNAFGPIVPDHAFPAAVSFVNTASGAAGADYESLFATPFDPITMNGLFFTLELTAQSVAFTTDSQVQLTFAGYFGPGDTDQLMADIGDPINVRVLGDVASVPEPSSCLLFSVGVCAIGLLRLRHRRLELISSGRVQKPRSN